MSEAWKVTPDAGTQFDVALDWFAKRVPLTDAERKVMPVDARSRSFWIAGVAQLDVVETVMGELKKALAAGTPISDFQTAVRDLLARQWGKDNPARLETIFRNALQNAYNAGRYEQMTKPEMLRFRPYWLFDAILDGRTTVVCKVCGGTLLPSDDPWWDTHWPPLHHRCRSSVRALRASEAQRRGITETAPVEPGDTGFGLSPKLAKEWRPDAAKHTPSLIEELHTKKADNDQTPAPPPLPKAFDKTPKHVVPEPPPAKGPGKQAPLKLSSDAAKDVDEAREKAGKFYDDKGITLRRRKDAAVDKAVKAIGGKALREVHDLFCGDFGQGWYAGSAGPIATIGKMVQDNVDAAALRETANVLGAERNDVVPWARAQYAATQEALKRRIAAGTMKVEVDDDGYVTLWRGVNGEQADGLLGAMKANEAAELKVRALSSWTSERGTAEYFAGSKGAVIKQRIHVSRIFMQYEQTGKAFKVGGDLESEWVVISDPDEKMGIKATDIEHSKPPK